MKYQRKKRGKTEREMGIALNLKLPSRYNQRPLRNLPFESCGTKAAAEHACTGHNSPQSSWNIVIQTHQISTIGIGEGYIQDYIHCFSQTELWYGRAIEFFRACIAKEFYTSPGYLQTARRASS